MFYTGYYSKLGEYKSAGLKLVSISRTKPKGLTVDGDIPELYPEKDLLWGFKNMDIEEMEYTSKYLDQLDRIGIKDILLKIHSFGNDVVLLCWEAPGKFCHRHILADYINRNSKLNVEEYKIKQYRRSIEDE